MKNNPTYDTVQFPFYMTQRQKVLLKEVAKKRGAPLSELLREAVHLFLKKHGRWDGLIYSEEEFMVEYVKGVEEMRMDAVRRERESDREKEMEMARDVALRMDRERNLKMEREREEKRERQRAKEKEIVERFIKGGPAKNDPAKSKASE